jgi:hypothetical protein
MSAGVLLSMLATSVTLPELLIVFVPLVVVPLPAYIVGARSGVHHPGIAFIPLVGLWIVLFRVIGKSGWFALLVFIPYLGGLVSYVWLAISIPRRHRRTGWWSVALILLPLVSNYVYAFSLHNGRVGPAPTTVREAIAEKDRAAFQALESLHQSRQRRR